MKKKTSDKQKIEFSYTYCLFIEYVEITSRQCFQHEPDVDQLSLNTILGGVTLNLEGGGIVLGTHTHHNSQYFTWIQI